MLASLRQLRVIKTAVDLREGSHTVKAEYQELRNSKPPSKRLNLSPMDPKQPPPHFIGLHRIPENPKTTYIIPTMNPFRDCRVFIRPYKTIMIP